MEGFAYQAFGLDPIQQATAASGEKHAKDAAPMLDFEKVSDPKNPLTATFQLKTRKRNTRRIR